MYVHVLVKAGGKEEGVMKIDHNHYSVTVREPAERNMANRRVIELLRLQYPAAGQIKIISGHHSPSKLFAISMPGE